MRGVTAPALPGGQITLIILKTLAATADRLNPMQVDSKIWTGVAWALVIEAVAFILIYSLWRLFS